MKTCPRFSLILAGCFFALIPFVTLGQTVYPEDFNFSRLSKDQFRQLPRISEEEEIDGGWKPLKNFKIPAGAKITHEADWISNTPVTPNVPSPLPAADFLGYIDPVQTIPPDPHGAVGLNHVVTASNDSVIVHTKKGVVVSRMSFATFMGSSTVSDPYMQYDPYLDRFWISGISSETTNKVYLAVSKTGDPSGDWWRYNFKPVSSDGDLLLDHPYLGLDNKLVLIGGRKFPGGTSFAGTILFAFDKASIAAGNPINFGINAQTIEKSPTDGDVPCPVTAYGLSTVPAAAFYIVQNWNGNSSTIRLSTVTGDIPFLTWNTNAAIYVSGGSSWSDGNLGNLAQQVDEPRRIAVNDSRISSAVMVNGKIWCTHHIGLPASTPNHTAIQWWQISPVGEVLQRGRIDDASGQISRYFPTIAVNAAENVLIGYTMSSSTTRINAAYSTRSTTTSANTTDDEYVYKGGVDTYWKDFGSGRARWGDYSHTALDPANGHIWTVQEYAEKRLGSGDNQSRYGLWWAEVSFNSFNNDAALSGIVEPNNGNPYCDAPLAASVVISNPGNKILNSVSVGLLVDGNPSGTENITGLSIKSFESKLVPLTLIVSASPGDHILTAYTFNPNGVADERKSNDTTQITFSILPDLPLPYSTSFEDVTFPASGGWTVFNPDANITWERTDTAAKTGTHSMWYNAFKYNAPGEVDILRSPKISLSATDSVVVQFDVAYGRHTNIELDSLQVVYSVDCGKTWLPTTYNKFGPGLATNTNFFSNQFVPAAADWRHERVSLAACGINADFIMLGLKAVNDYGNNIFIDNLAISRVAGSINNIALKTINVPGGLLCNTTVTPVVTILNNGSDTLNNFNISYQIDNGAINSNGFNVNLARCNTQSLSLPNLTASMGNHSLKIFTSQPNRSVDEDLSNDTLVANFTVSPTLDADISEGFESQNFPPDNWGVINEDGKKTWERTTVTAKTGSGSMAILNSNYSSGNTKDNFISPIVNYDMAADSFFVSFDYATAPGLTFPGGSDLPLDTLEVLISQDCGSTFKSVWKKWGTSLATIRDSGVINGTAFVPAGAEDWKSIKLFLNPYIGQQNFQVFFRATSNHQNNIYLDNINIYKKILPARLKQQGYLVYPIPFHNSLVLRHYQPPLNLKSILIFNSLGQKVFRKDYNGGAVTEEALNVSGLPAGLYILRLIYDDHSVSEKLIKN